MMNLKVKKLHPDAVMPTRTNPTDTGYDLTAITDGRVTDEYIEYNTGLSVQPEEGYYTEIVPRSSITKTNLVLGNSVGIIDQMYTGELLVRFKIIHPTTTDQNGNICFSQKAIKKYSKGDRIAQLIVRTRIDANLVEVEELDKTERGDGGFGSSNLPKL